MPASPLGPALRGPRPWRRNDASRASCPRSRRPADPWLMATDTAQGKPGSEVNLVSDSHRGGRLAGGGQRLVLRPEAQRRPAHRAAHARARGAHAHGHPPRPPGDHRAGAAQVGAGHGGEDRRQQRDGGVPARIPAGGHRRGGGHHGAPLQPLRGSGHHRVRGSGACW